MKNFVIETISELLDIKVSEISLTSSFEDLEIDNLDLVEIIMALEDKLEITADDSMYDTKTVGELIKHIEQLTNK
ncbi:MAG: acyl carrier protein [Bacteroidales bacterium]|jgi:acyl carrier protein|nr:acyl carrier protein [Bacteroidales bacterium]MCK4638997.1 acyl carrier protein [Bacteroidales bacterium]